MKLKLHEIELNSRNPEASKDFYHGLLGLPIGQDLEGLKVFDSGWPNVDIDASIHFPGQTLISFLVEDLEAFIAELKAKGVEVDEPKDTHLGMRSIMLTDPDGHKVAIQTPTDASPDWLKEMVK